MLLPDYVRILASGIVTPSKRPLIKAALALRNKTGLEVGGPSPFFKAGFFPVYSFARRIDGINFSAHTIWEGSLTEGRTYNYDGNKKGEQYIGEASALDMIPYAHYDFLLSCHSLEHVANPLLALHAWRRVLKPNGTLILVLPDKERSFDVHRPYTSFDHLLQDYKNNTGENDRTHFEEVIAAHIQFSGGNREEVAALVAQNETKRYVHHHVFHQDVVRELLQFCGFTCVYQQKAAPFHLITVARRLEP